MEDLLALGPSGAVVIVVVAFIKFLVSRDKSFRNCLDRNSSALEKNANAAGTMAEAIRRINGYR